MLLPHFLRAAANNVSRLPQASVEFGEVGGDTLGKFPYVVHIFLLRCIA